jgi:hypothetical protein
MIYVVCIWTDLALVLKLFEMLGFRRIRTQKMMVSFLNYAIFFYNDFIQYAACQCDTLSKNGSVQSFSHI